MDSKNCRTEVTGNMKSCTSCEASKDKNDVNINRHETSDNISANKRSIGRFAAGFLGSLLFSAAGGYIYWFFYRISFIAVACAVIIYALTFLGYRLFSGASSGFTVCEIIVATVISVLTVIVSEYFSLSYMAAEVMQNRGIECSLTEVMRQLPAIINQRGTISAVLGELSLACLFCIISALVTFLLKRRKR